MFWSRDRWRHVLLSVIHKVIKWILIFNQSFTLISLKVEADYNPPPSLPTLPTFSLICIPPVKYYKILKNIIVGRHLAIPKCPTPIKPRICHLFSNRYRSLLIITWKWSRDWWRHWSWSYVTTIAILLWCETLLCTKLPKLWSFKKIYHQGILGIFYYNCNLLWLL